MTNKEFEELMEDSRALNKAILEQQERERLQRERALVALQAKAR